MPAREGDGRGCLYKLVVQNFKSYAGYLEIGPFKDFTCVIGPNGSGKSNLMDAISFVVGVTTTTLRGSRIADFRSNLSTASGSPTSVSLFYRGPEKGSGKFEEIQFTRTITSRDTSEYKIDNKKVDEKEYQKRLKSIGLLVKSRNFLVFQNEVEAVAQKTPKQLTDLLERISGSEDLKHQYEELMEQKSAASQTAVAVYKRSLLVSNEKKQCKEQVKEANTYEKLLNDLNDLKTNHVLFDLYQIDKQIESHASEAENFGGKLEESSKNCKAVSNAADKKAKQKAEKQKDWSAIDKKVEDLEKKIKNIQRQDLLKLSTEISSRKADINKNTEELKNSKDKLQEMTQKLKSEEKERNDLEAALKEVESRSKKKGIDLVGEQVSEYNQLKSKAFQMSHTAKAALEKTERADQEDRRELERLELEVKRCQQRIESLTSKMKDDSAVKSKNVSKLQGLNEEKHKCSSELTDVTAKFKDETARKKVLMNEIRELREKIGEAHIDHNQNQRDEQFKIRLEHLASSFPGVRGRVMDLCKVRQRQHELAMAITMEGNMDAVVVEKEETVRRCIEHLKEQKVPPMTFLPLDSISAKPPDERLRMIQGAKLALDCIEYDKSVEKAMWYVTGNTVLVPTLQDAKNLAYQSQSVSSLRCKVVSHDGALISKSGTMTGGDNSHLQSKAQRWQANEIDKLKEKLDKCIKELESVSKTIEVLEKAKTSLEKKLSDNASELSVFQKLKESQDSDQKVREKEIDHVKRQEENLAPKIQKIKRDIDSRKKTLEEERAALDKINDVVYRDFCKKLGIKSIAEFEGGSLKEQREIQGKINELTQQKARVEGVIAKTKANYSVYVKALEDKKVETKKLEEEIASLKSKEESSKKKMKEAMDAKEEELRKQKAIKEEIDEIEKEYKEINKVLKKANEDRDEISRQLEKAEAQMQRLRDKRRGIFEQCKMDEIEIPTKKKKDGSNDDDEDQSMEVEAEHSQTAKEIREEVVQSRIDFSKLPREHKRDLSEKDQEKIRTELDEKQRKINDTLQTMNPNMKAHEQLKEIEERYEAVQQELSSAKQNSQDLTKQFEEVKQKRCDLFNKCFDHVKGCIDEIYKELTCDPTKVEQSVGGSAYLTLNNQEEPYMDGIKYDTIPPGKRFMDMTHLSGGEKTVAALALLFAINSYCPAPFIVLDEVDAALDARNVAKVTRYIQSRRHEQQCVIISLKERFYEKADGLVGICRDITGGHSNVFTLDLSMYEDGIQ